MKTLVTTILITICSCIAFAQTDNLNGFFKKTGAKDFAALAHPTNTFQYASWEFDGDYILLHIEYKNDITTNLKIKKSYGWFTEIATVSDNDFPPPFFATELIKNAVWKAIKDDNKDMEKLSEFEKYCRKKFEDMTGEQLTCLLLSIEWLDY